MDTHKLLKRQLDRFELDSTSIPTDLKQWQSLLTAVTNAYTEAEQERYLIERSIEVSSNEFLGLTEKLETAQYIARLGYWSYSPQKDVMTLSNTLYKLLGLESISHIINKQEFLQLIHEEDKPSLAQSIEQAVATGKKIEQTIRIANSQNAYNWYYITGALNAKDGKENQELHGIAMDINQRKKDEEELASLNQQLINTARLAGMADVAISVLHNIGNVLNSANVAIGLVQELMAKPHFQKLSAIVSMIRENTPDIGNYLTQDPKGKLIPEYLVALNEAIEKDQTTFLKEIEKLSSCLNHVKEIIAMQQGISKTHGIVEKCFLPELIENILKINEGLFSKQGIIINTDYKDSGFIQTDKTKLTQILINLLQNAQEATSINEGIKPRKLDFLVQKNPENIKIIVEDNGVGISPENLQKLFTFGFTTKQKGHGFGLHSSILAAREIGGDLKADSKGEGQGATFTLTLPLPPSGI